MLAALLNFISGESGQAVQMLQPAEPGEAELTSASTHARISHPTNHVREKQVVDQALDSNF